MYGIQDCIEAVDWKSSTLATDLRAKLHRKVLVAYGDIAPPLLESPSGCPGPI